MILLIHIPCAKINKALFRYLKGVEFLEHIENEIRYDVLGFYFIMFVAALLNLRGWELE